MKSIAILVLILFLGVLLFIGGNTLYSIIKELWSSAKGVILPVIAIVFFLAIVVLLNAFIRSVIFALMKEADNTERQLFMDDMQAQNVQRKGGRPL